MPPLVHMAALIAMAQATASVLPRDTCHINPKSLGGATIELMSNFAPFVRRTYDPDHKFVFFSHGMSKSGRWYSKGQQICTEVYNFIGCGYYRVDGGGVVYIVDNAGIVEKYRQRKGSKIECR